MNLITQFVTRKFGNFNWIKSTITFITISPLVNKKSIFSTNFLLFYNILTSQT